MRRSDMGMPTCRMRIICTGIDCPARADRPSDRAPAGLHPATAADAARQVGDQCDNTTQLVASTVADALLAAFDKDPAP